MFKIFDIIDAPMQKRQLEVYNYKKKLIKEKEEESTIWSAETQISNFIYQTLKETKNDISMCYGEEGFKGIIKKIDNNTYKFKNEDFGLRFLKHNIKEYSKQDCINFECH